MVYHSHPTNLTKMIKYKHKLMECNKMHNTTNSLCVNTQTYLTPQKWVKTKHRQKNLNKI